jgi:hypothetical protein
MTWKNLSDLKQGLVLFSKHDPNLLGDIAFNKNLSSILGWLISYPDISHSLFSDHDLHYSIEGIFLHLF